MDPLMIPVLLLALLFGVVIGSFLNVCIYRIPEKKTVVTERSHCMQCGYQLSWYDMIPVASWLALRGKCRKCRARISAQYPLIEAANGILYVVVFLACGISIESLFYCFLGSALIVLSVIDFRIYEIPFGINVFIFVLGVVHLCLDYTDWTNYLIGFFAISLPLELLLLLSKGRAIGGGDVKLMAAAGLLLGWKKILLAFIIGVVAGSILHLIRMKVAQAERVLAMGPYLSLGIIVSALWGDALIEGYMRLFF